MAVTDLTNTTWNIPAGWTCSAGYGYFVIEGNINDDYFQYSVGFGKGSWNGDDFPNASNSIAYWTNDGSVAHFSSSTPLTIVITGGADATNTNLISWLEANGTQVIDMTPKEQFVSKLNELSDAINEKAKTSGKMTISQMIENVKGISGGGSGELSQFTSITFVAKSDYGYTSKVILEPITFGKSIIIFPINNYYDTFNIRSNKKIKYSYSKHRGSADFSANVDLWLTLEPNTKLDLGSYLAIGTLVFLVQEDGDLEIQYYITQD